MGMNLPFYKVLAFGTGASRAGRAGVLPPPSFYFFHPAKFPFLPPCAFLVRPRGGGRGTLRGSVGGPVPPPILPPPLQPIPELRRAL